MTDSDNRGRPRIYTFPDRRRIAELIRLHGARGTRETMSRQISLNTVLKIAREFEIELKKGKRPKRAA